MAAAHRSKGECAPVIRSLWGLAYNEAGATWILTSEFAQNRADSKRACNGGPLHQNWATVTAHSGGLPVSRCSKMDMKQPPQAHRGLG
jgi:hypothetical protein